MTFRTIVARSLSRLVLGWLPARFRLPFHYFLFRIQGVGGEPELECLALICKKRQVALDIGSNEGLYAYKMSQLFKTVYAFEINEDLVGDLVAYNPGNISIITMGLSSEARSAEFYVPVWKGMPLHGWGSLARDNCPETSEHLIKQVMVRTLDSFEIEGVSFIKIDVEGHELEVLRGAIKTMSVSRPRVLVEIKEPSRKEVFSLFTDLNYSNISLMEIAAKAGGDENFLFVPNEELKGRETNAT